MKNEKKISILFCGDTFLKTKDNKSDPFYFVRNEFQNYNIIFLNLETVINSEINDHAKSQKHVTLIETPDKLKYIQSIENNKIKAIVNIAQNHILDFGTSGLNETLNHLDNHNIEHIGLREKPSVTINCNGKKILFTSGYNRYQFFEKNSDLVADEHDVERQIKEYRDKVDIVIVSMHWGTEHVLYANPTQQKLARHFIKIGADLVVGHHPHCIQGYERYLDKEIYYSLGNFNYSESGRTPEKKNKKNFMLQVNFTELSTCQSKVIPIYINDNFQPILDSSHDTIEKMEFISKFNYPKINPVLFYRIAAKTYLAGNLNSKIYVLKKHPAKIVNTIIWLFCKPFNIFCYLALLLNLLLGDKSSLNDWE